MGMNIKVNSIDALTLNIQQIVKGAIENGSDIMYDEGRKLESLAQALAPRDTGTLEEAIENITSRGDRNRVEINVYVNTDHVNSRTGRSLSDYAEEMELYLEPVGSKYKRRKGTLAKNENLDFASERGFYGAVKGFSDDGAFARGAGGGFMRRALQARQGQIAKRIAEGVRRAIARKAAK